MHACRIIISISNAGCIIHACINKSRCVINQQNTRNVLTESSETKKNNRGWKNMFFQYIMQSACMLHYIFKNHACRIKIMNNHACCIIHACMHALINHHVSLIKFLSNIDCSLNYAILDPPHLRGDRTSN